ncbi:DUF3147 family protein [Sulfoacidibacillus thermotolerans]|uniref:DUF3147 family protein n=1 Tax=Sulfoacidibacillus thermotolerans TaxID=1765684 RepID=A0A2U3DC63_SULT2|nr:DUF3147 family protein [Sulfoacidibacillus thermotolerans]PWI58873.1 hypothetical protein BM613_01955 [Sulfoacidibacillus thermotolerans]
MLQLFVRFMIGGSVVAIASVLSRYAPYLSGMLSGFPAVFFVSLIFIYLSARQKAVISYASTAFWGMIGSVLTVAATGIGAMAGWAWPLVIGFGLVIYFVFVAVALIFTSFRQKAELNAEFATGDVNTAS